ncbi:type 1 glutamine amidotransferase domain-containing protein [Aspergillus undulatus]|uniref:type 1 glutamine amidotransferase domain-containing protein n=1 Tax=Aspergillus undulatus TaxID=1810928 RepID=UPI003CCE1457
MAPKVLIVLTSSDRNPVSGNDTGWFLPKFAHPWDVLQSKVYFVVASPKGGVAPLSPQSVEMYKDDPSSARFLKEQSALWENTVKLSDVLSRVDEFDAIFYPGGHGPMFDLYFDPESIALIENFAVAKKPIASVCHGPAVLVEPTLPSGEPLISSATVTGFSNVEEDALGASGMVPFLLEDALDKLSGGRYVKAEETLGEKVVVSEVKGLGGVLITGQSPASAKGVGEALAKALGLAWV